MTVQETSDTQTAPLNVDDKCNVHWRSGQQILPAVVVERRPLGHRKRKKNERAPDLSTLSSTEVEYYVHYVDHDRYVVAMAVF
jgi:hypothetical protein